MITRFAPIILFTYKRLDALKYTVAALQQNFYASDTELFIFSDAAKTENEEKSVEEVRSYLKTISGFKNVYISESKKNKGLSKSIIEGVSKIFEQHNRVIVLEDDLVTSKNFISFMNQGLDFYEQDQRVFSIAGFSYIIKGLTEQDIYFTKRAESWGWASWKDRWNNIDWEVKGYEVFKKDTRQRRAFNRMGSDMAGLLDKQMNGNIDSWAIRWCYHQFLHNKFTVFPGVSKVVSIGYTKEATHTKNTFQRYKTVLDSSNNEVFNFHHEISLDPRIIKQVTKHHSIPTRIKYKILNYIPVYPKLRFNDKKITLQSFVQ